jgi:hypothetical protein
MIGISSSFPAESRPHVHRADWTGISSRRPAAGEAWSNYSKSADIPCKRLKWRMEPAKPAF